MKQEYIDKFYDSLDELIYNYLQNGHLGDDDFRNSMDILMSFPILSLIRLSKQNPDDPQIDISKIPQSSRDKLSVEINNFRHLYSEMMSNVDISDNYEAQLTEAREQLKEKDSELALRDKMILELKAKNASLQENLNGLSGSNESYRDFPFEGLSFRMIKVKGGNFNMSNNYKVTLSDYYIGEVPVTQRLWKAVMAGTKAEEDINFGFKGDDRPAERVSWNMICGQGGFLDRLNDTLKDQLPKGMKFQLPTEAQWAFAARGGTKSMGYYYSGSDTIEEVAWYSGNSSNETHSVKDSSKKANELGIHGMSGNVWEWCQDWYADSYPSEESKDPKGPSCGSHRVYCGGSWGDGAGYCEVSSCGHVSPSSFSYFIGFRLALSK